jgi:hypothetical protein
MTKVTIVAENPGSPDTTFRASAGDHESVGRTAGAALDELTRQLGEDERGTIVVVQNFRPDAFFSTAQQARLRELLANWRAARAGGDRPCHPMSVRNSSDSWARNSTPQPDGPKHWPGIFSREFPLPARRPARGPSMRILSCPRRPRSIWH